MVVSFLSFFRNQHLLTSCLSWAKTEWWKCMNSSNWLPSKAASVISSPAQAGLSVLKATTESTVCPTNDGPEQVPFPGDYPPNSKRQPMAISLSGVVLSQPVLPSTLAAPVWGLPSNLYMLPYISWVYTQFTGARGTHKYTGIVDGKQSQGW